ncbi:uncharacterized protein LOC116843467 isoform X2 [Odontomachus brunneus]|uniref:uncharacterized protein LOC116843467 isoform X2 n=1 Tax=Odontomachus brunneus TaxID=486640 RepID=UPI0013F26EE1|nr:uncharacterized protein LOC116843467 isoform X2 [Odontomachus brunneus]
MPQVPRERMYAMCTGYFLVGSFHNPALGASLRFSCSGLRDYHSLVHWAALFCGSLCALVILRLCNQLAYYIASRLDTRNTRNYIVFKDIRYEGSQQIIIRKCSIDLNV